MIKPLGEKVVVKPGEEEETTAGGIVLPDTAKKKPQEGEVVAVGLGRLLDNGERRPPEVNIGDTIVYSKYGGTEITLSGVDYVILDEDSILAIKEDKKKSRRARRGAH